MAIQIIKRWRLTLINSSSNHVRHARIAAIRLADLNPDETRTA